MWFFFGLFFCFSFIETEMGGEMNMHELIFRCGAFRVLETPVMVTSGEFLTPFFCNTENFCGDREIDAFLQSYGSDPAAITERAARLLQTQPSFKQVVYRLTERAETIIGGWIDGRRPVISGGQRRDWLFSGPVAGELGLPHISIFKPNTADGSQKILYHSTRSPGPAEEIRDLSGCRVLHIADLITRGSSIFDVDASGLESGWVPALRNRGAVVEDLLAVISRNQGGEQMLAERGVAADSLLTVDASFIAEHVPDPRPLLQFLEDPRAWTEAFLNSHGPEPLFAYCRADDKKLPRLMKFIRKYRRFLEQNGWLESLEEKLDGGGHEAA
jgi:hypothetical protein